MVEGGGGVAAHHLHLGLEEMEVMEGGQVVMEVQVICMECGCQIKGGGGGKR